LTLGSVLAKAGLVKRVGIHEARTQLSRRLEEVERGDRIIIARSGEPVAVVSRCKAAVRRRRLGWFAGEAMIRPDFDELASDIAAAPGAEWKARARHPGVPLIRARNADRASSKDETPCLKLSGQT
jgi:antitoxin (DNA-binding transcriptional repressor) of toxin-antitoxin stability system